MHMATLFEKEMAFPWLMGCLLRTLSKLSKSTLISEQSLRQKNFVFCVSSNTLSLKQVQVKAFTASFLWI